MVATHRDRGVGAVSDAVDVVIVGGGPSGLALALQAHDHGARVRVVERRVEAFRPSRALIVHSRTLEVLRPLGVTDALRAAGEISPPVQLHLGRRKFPVQLGDFDIPDTPYPHLLFARQAVVETVLSQALSDRGIEVERGVELVDLRHDSDQAAVTLRRAGSVESVSCRYVAGCDGVSSTVRRLAGIDWRGGSYPQQVVLADVELDGDLTPGVAHVVAAGQGVLFIFAVGELATWRLLATRSPGGAPRDDRHDGAVPIHELQGLLDEAGLPVRVEQAPWSTCVRLQCGVASRYRRGPVFLVGDAAHVHSPAGGQGMNTGIQDAVNLGWKLAFAAASFPGPDALLASYEAERRAVAWQVLALTHALFWAEGGTDPLVRFARGRLAPLASPMVPWVLRRRRLVANGVRVISQLRVHYRRSKLSVEGSPRGRREPRPGERLPNQPVIVAGGRRQLHEVVAHPGIHVLLERDAVEHEDPNGPFVHLHRIQDWPGTGVSIVRPDGYVGFRSASVDPNQIASWLRLVGVRPTTSTDRHETTRGLEAVTTQDHE